MQKVGSKRCCSQDKDFPSSKKTRSPGWWAYCLFCLNRGDHPLAPDMQYCSPSFPTLPLALHWQSISFVTKQFQKCFRNTEDCANGSHRSAHHGCLLGCHWAGFCDGLEVLGHHGSFTKALSSKHQEIKARQTSKRHLSQSKGWCKEAPCTESCLF